MSGICGGLRRGSAHVQVNQSVNGAGLARVTTQAERNRQESGDDDGQQCGAHDAKVLADEEIERGMHGRVPFLNEWMDDCNLDHRNLRPSEQA